MKKRTNLVLDEVLVEVIRRRYGLRTMTEAVDLALRKVADEPMTREEMLEMEGANLIAEIPPDRGPRGDD
jgi:Arc/MetJ family transcription regulator